MMACSLWLLRAAQAPPPPQDHRLEDNVKAAFLFNFLKFMDWGAQPPDRPWIIAVVGDDTFASVLQETIAGKTIGGHPVLVKRLRHAEGAGGCHIVFIPGPMAAPLAAPPGVLTVGDSPGFLDSGGMVVFFLDAGKLRFEIRAAAVSSAGLHMSSQLLRLGRAR
jgi:uncharacterized protein DUF4154